MIGGMRDLFMRHVTQGMSLSGYERDALFLNLAGKRFIDISGVSGLDSISDGRGPVYADFDNDGDMDVFVPTIQDRAHLMFRNNIGTEGNFVRVSLRGTSASGTDAFGAVVRVRSSAGVQAKIKAGGEGFMSQHDPRLLFGLGSDSAAASIEVEWPSGKKQTITNVKAGSSILIAEGVSGYQPSMVAARVRKTPSKARPIATDSRIRLQAGESFPLMATDPAFAAAVRKNTKTLVNIWATWCVPCAREMPSLQRAANALREKRIGVAGVSVDDDLSRVPIFLEKYNITFPSFPASEKVREQIYSGSDRPVPLTFVLDSRGHIERVLIGATKTLAYVDTLSNQH
jgi:thiol-disulfide isomerase/thioredoxin